MRLDQKNMLIYSLFPRADKRFRTRLRDLTDDKDIRWDRNDISAVLHDIMASIIRHECTHYDQCVRQVKREQARFFTQGCVTKMMKQFKGI